MREHDYASPDCWCSPRCLRICPTCDGEMCSDCDWIGAVEGDLSEEGGNIIVHRHGGSRLMRAAAVRAAVEAVLAERR